MISALTRLTIGGLLTGYDGLTRQLLVWEKEIDRREGRGDTVGMRVVETPGSEEDTTDRLRYAAIGMLFNTGEALSESLETVGQVARLAGDWLDIFVSPVYSSRLLSPVRKSVDRLAEHGQSLVEEWIDRVREEEAQSRALASTALVQQVDSSIQYLTSNDEVQELVKSQSVGLVGEIVEETRERTVSADNYLEAWARTIFRKPLQLEPLEPAPEVKARAAPLHVIGGRVIKK